MLQRICCIVFLSFLVIVGIVRAEPLGTAFTYQGEVLDSGSAPTGVYDFRFTLYDAVSDGNIVGGTLSIVSVQVVRGRFTAELDFGSLVFTGDLLWLEVEVRNGGSGSYSTLTPRQKLTPEPSSIFSAMADWSGLINVPAGFADNVDNDTLAGLVCGAGQILQYNGGWNCANGAGGITSVQPEVGSGLTGGGNSGDILLGTDAGVLQRRIVGTCPVGLAIQAVNQDGTVVCSSMLPAPEVVGDTGWFSVPMRTEVTVDLGTSSYDFVFGLVRSSDSVTGRFVSPIMGAAWRDYMPAYIGLDGSSATVLGYQSLANGFNLGYRNTIEVLGGDIRLRAVERTPDYDSGWTSCSSNITYLFSHGLGALPTFGIVEVAENSDGSGWRVPTMATSYNDGPGWYQTAIVEMTTSTVALRTHGVLAQFRSTATGTLLSPTTGFCRVRLFDWAADYDSGWVAYSNSTGDREKWLQHQLGQMPSLVMLWVAENADGSGWHLPAMFPLFHFRNRGTRIYSITDNWAVVQGGADDVAQFVDRDGVGQVPSNGYMRFLAWR